MAAQLAVDQLARGRITSIRRLEVDFQNPLVVACGGQRDFAGTVNEFACHFFPILFKVQAKRLITLDDAVRHALPMAGQRARGSLLSIRGRNIGGRRNQQ